MRACSQWKTSRAFATLEAQRLLVFGQLVYTVFVLPPWAEHLGEPCYWAGLGSIASSLQILSLHATGRRGTRFERLTLSLFLAAMPLVYVASWLRSPEPGWLLPELAGVACRIGTRWHAASSISPSACTW